METALPNPVLARSASWDAHAEARLLAADFDRVVREHQRRVYRVLYAILRDADAADTLTQECFLRAWQQRAGFRGEASIATWLRRIAVNLAIDHQRSRRASFWKRLFAARDATDGAAGSSDAPDALANLAAEGASLERRAIAQQQVARLWEVVAQLPMQQRAIFTLRFAEELTLDEIAQTMNLQIGTVKAHLFRAVHTVRSKMK